MSSDEAYDAALDLLRRLDPTKLETNLSHIISLDPDLASDLLSSVDTPLLVKTDPECSNREYLCCDYNRDIDSHRSPWSNKYFPELSTQDLEESPFPSEQLRQLEALANDSFDIYRDLYYEGGVSSVYLWDLDEEAHGPGTDFAGVVLFKKGEESSSSWDSIHVLEVIHDGSEATYRVTTTIILHLDNKNNVSLSGNLTRQTERTFSVPSNSKDGQLSTAHITNLGTLIEDIESKMRNLLEVVYFDKTRDIYHELRFDSNGLQQAQSKSKHEEVIKGLQDM